jgi:small subunit ribosomal protein S20
MPNNRNAEKAVRQTEKRRLRNRAGRTVLKTVIRKAEVSVAGKVEVDATEAQKTFRAAIKKIDQAAAKHLIHKNKAARLKSQLAKKAAAKTEKK